MEVGSSGLSPERASRSGPFCLWQVRDSLGPQVPVLPQLYLSCFFPSELYIHVGDISPRGGVPGPQTQRVQSTRMASLPSPALAPPLGTRPLFLGVVTPYDS